MVGENTNTNHGVNLVATKRIVKNGTGKGSWYGVV